MKISVVFSILLLFLALGCSKIERLTSISGKVIDYGSNDPIENVKIHIRDGWNGSSPFTESDNTSDAETIVYTGEDGSFFAELCGRFNAYLYPSHPHYWDYDLGETAVTNKANGYNKGTDTENVIIQLKAMAWYRALIIPDEVADSIRYIALNEDLSLKWLSNFYNNDPFYFPNNSGEDLAIGNSYYRYKLKYKRNGVWNEIIDSVYIEKLETYLDTINF